MTNHLLNLLDRDDWLDFGFDPGATAPGTTFARHKLLCLMLAHPLAHLVIDPSAKNGLWDHIDVGAEVFGCHPRNLHCDLDAEFYLCIRLRDDGTYKFVPNRNYGTYAIRGALFEHNG